MDPDEALKDHGLLGRKTLCLPSDEPGVAAHVGDLGFVEGITQHFQAAENNAAEKFIALKAELKVADTETFWRRLMEGLTEICNAQYGFVAKRILVDDHDSAVEMPPIGEPGSCLMGVAFYYNDGKDPPNMGMHRDYKYMAWGAPCAHMKHDKVFLIPERLGTFIANNPNKFPFPAEAYLGVPLFSEGKCFAHFGLMWTKDGLETRDLGWGYLEMILHSLEDVILERLISGQGFAKDVSKKKASQVIPQEAITASQSLKPYARSLSHELRTPMQGVVGMLDVMHATVQEAIEGQSNPKLRNIFQALKENIEVVQDSSRRAVEAADNVVHAYDLNMQVPDTPQNPNDEDSPLTAGLSSTSVFDHRPNILIEGSNIPVNPYKRRRSSPVDWSYGNPPKHRALKPSERRILSPRSQELKNVVHESGHILRYSSELPSQDIESPGRNDCMPSVRASLETDIPPTTGIGQSKVRDLLHLVINESLRVGGRPDSAIADDTVLGERIEVRSRSSSGHASTKLIEWSVDPAVPETVQVDERDLAKLISCVFLNAIKFTESGRITVTATLSRNTRYVVFIITDTGTGIPKDFLPELFKPFSQEDDSLTRSKEGLGLGLLVAKGIARKIGGDLNCVRSNTSGPLKGSEFEIKVPVSSSDSGSSRPESPVNRTPTPSRNSSFFSASDTAKQVSGYHSRTLRSSAGNSPLNQSSPSRHNSQPLGPKRLVETPAIATNSPRRVSSATSKGRLPSSDTFDRSLSQKHPITFLVAEDNKINRKLLVNMLGKLGYKDVYEAFDGKEAVRVMKEVLESASGSKSSVNTRKTGKSEKLQGGRLKPIDVVLMDLWMPEMDGYEATKRIFELVKQHEESSAERAVTYPTILAVSADVTDEAISRATTAGMEGFMTKPYKLPDLQRLIEEYCVRNDRG